MYWIWGLCSGDDSFGDVFGEDELGVAGGGAWGVVGSDGAR